MGGYVAALAVGRLSLFGGGGFSYAGRGGGEMQTHAVGGEQQHNWKTKAFGRRGMPEITTTTPPLPAESDKSEAACLPRLSVRGYLHLHNVTSCNVRSSHTVNTAVV